MTNREWINGLPNKLLAHIMADCFSEICRGDGDTLDTILEDRCVYDAKHSKDCKVCMNKWLGSEHQNEYEDMEDMKDLKRYITNYRGDTVEVPNEGDEIFYVAQCKDDDSMRVECLLWEDSFNYLYNLHQGRLFTSYMAAEHHRQKCMAIAQMAWVESGCAENYDLDNFFSKTVNKLPKGVDE